VTQHRRSQQSAGQCQDPDVLAEISTLGVTLIIVASLAAAIALGTLPMPTELRWVIAGLGFVAAIAAFLATRPEANCTQECWSRGTWTITGLLEGILWVVGVAMGGMLRRGRR
jgi:hypothetical protein